MSQDTPQNNQKDPFDIDFDFGLSDDEKEQSTDELLAELEALGTDKPQEVSLGELNFDESSTLDEVGDIIFDEPVTNPTHNTAVDDITTETPPTNTNDDLPRIDEIIDTPQESVSLPQTPIAEPQTDMVVGALPPKKAKKPLFSFGSKTKKPSEPKTKKTTPPKAPKPPKTAKSGKPYDPKKLNMLIAGATFALLLLVGAWFLTKNNEPATPETASSTPAPVVEPTPAPEPEPVVEELSETEVASTEAPAGDSSIVAGETPVVDAEAIVNAEIPEDPALIKEEIDRLADKDGQLQEQAKLIDEQLDKLEELTAAKEEQIALLEAQIAQLESQKSQ